MGPSMAQYVMASYVTPRTVETLLRFRDFPQVYPNGNVFYPCERLQELARSLLRHGLLR
jgi:hypothetical protein